MTPWHGTYDSSVWAAVVIRAPDAAWNGSHYVGSILEDVDESQASRLGIDYKLVRERRFCAVAAASREALLQVQAALNLRWQSPIADSNAIVGAPIDAYRFRREYRWHATGVPETDPSLPRVKNLHQEMPCKAEWIGDILTLWVSTTRDDELIAEAAAIFDVPVEHISIVGTEVPADQASYDAAIDAAVISRAVRRPIQIWPMVGHDADEVQILGLASDTEAAGRPPRWTVQPDRPAVLRPSAALVTMMEGQKATRFQAARSTGSEPFRVDYADFDPLEEPIAATPLGRFADPHMLRAATHFAQESFADELAQEAGVDPVLWRLERLRDPAGRALVEQVAAAANWRPGIRGQGVVQDQAGGRRGQGLACAQVFDESSSPPKSAWAAWVVDVSVDRTGLLTLDKVTVGHHLDELVIADGRDIDGQHELMRTARALLDTGQHDRWTGRTIPGRPPATAVHAAAAIASSARTDLAKRIGSEKSSPRPLSSSEALALPAAAAVANAIYDATGIRLRDVPFAMHQGEVPSHLEASAGNAASRAKSAITVPKRKPLRGWALPLTILGSLAGAAMAVIPWRSPIAPVIPDLSIYSADAIERGRLIAAASDCVVCHTRPGGIANTGGLAMDTPFGTIYTTNITPDRETGIGAWSFAAFDRAMRQGISRDGRHLYPAFPYTAFARFSEEDMQALYAYLMSQPAVKSTPPATSLPFPFNVRSGMAYWNLLFHRNYTYRYDSNQSPVWNRGAYLVQGAGHCSACHSPRNILGAEKNGPRDFLAGGSAHGWDAPALNGTAPTTVPWTEKDLFQYLRTGFSERHGVAAGPMAPVVAGLQTLPDSDIHAISVYLATLNAAPSSASEATKPQEQHAVPGAMETSAGPRPRVLSLAGQSFFEGACGACHDTTSGGPLFGVRPNLALSTKITADKADNLIRVVLEGISQPVDSALGYMPGFADTLTDSQTAELISYLRARYAPQSPPWIDLEENVRRVRVESERHRHDASTGYGMGHHGGPLRAGEAIP
jgi:nicotinate dehydrogenase subunit B